MSAPALIRKQDMLRAAEVAEQTGCIVEIKVGDAVVTIRPRSEQIKETGIDYSRPSL